MYLQRNPMLLTNGSIECSFPLPRTSFQEVTTDTKYLQPLPSCAIDAHTHAHTLTHTYLYEKNVASTLRRPDARICRTHARPFGYISRAALIPAHIQSHPLILARSRGKKEREDAARGPTGPLPILVSCTCTPFHLTFSLSSSFTQHPRRDIHLSHSYSLLVYAYPSYGSSSNRGDAALVDCQSTSASSAELTTGFSWPFAHSLTHSLTAPA